MYLSHGVHPMKISVPALVLTLLFSALVGSLLVAFAEAQGPVGPGPDNPFTINVLTPQNNEALASSTVTLNFTVSFNPLIDLYRYTAMTYQLDGVELTLPTPSGVHFASSEAYSFILSGVNNGWHSLTVAATINCDYRIPPADGAFAVGLSGSSGVVQFLIDASPPGVSILSLKNATVNGGEVLLDFRVTDLSLSWVGYSLDEGGNVTISKEALAPSVFGSLTSWSGNLSLTGLSGGAHYVVVYGRDDAGNEGCSEFFSFVVTHQEGSQVSEPFPITLVAVSVIVSVAVSFGLVAYFLRRKKRSDEA
jgi:hypothetical protein